MGFGFNSVGQILRSDSIMCESFNWMWITKGSVIPQKKKIRPLSSSKHDDKKK